MTVKHLKKKLFSKKSIILKSNSNKKKSVKKNNGRKYSCRKDIAIYLGDNVLLKDSVCNVLKIVCEYILKEIFMVWFF